MFQDTRCTRLPQLITRNPTLDGYVPTVPYTLCTPNPPASFYLQRNTSPHLQYTRQFLASTSVDAVLYDSSHDYLFQSATKKRLPILVKTDLWSFPS